MTTHAIDMTDAFNAGEAGEVAELSADQQSIWEHMRAAGFAEPDIADAISYLVVDECLALCREGF